MALVRILIDGYSLLHQWPELAPGKARHSAAARSALIEQLRQYQDASGTPLTVVFDGITGPRGSGEPRSTRELEVLFTQTGQTADQVIERVSHRLAPFGEVLVVTEDHMERDTVASAGCMVSNCRNFIATMEDARRELNVQLEGRNRRERIQFKRGKSSG